MCQLQRTAPEASVRAITAFPSEPVAVKEILPCEYPTPVMMSPAEGADPETEDSQSTFAPAGVPFTGSVLLPLTEASKKYSPPTGMM